MPMRVYLFLIAFLSSSALLAQVDPDATALTKALYKNLLSMQGKSVLFGQQDALAYGLNADGSRWMNTDDRSDVKTVAGSHPAVAGWDLGRIEFDRPENLDGVPFALIKKRIIEHHQRGGVNTVSWHLNNPIDPSKTAWDKVEKTISRILNDPAALANYKKWLDKVASFFLDLKTPEGQLVPIIFRPFHEHTGSWFWWGADHCTPGEYTSFWKMTVQYLRDKNVHHLLIAYSTDQFMSKAHYLERYPGNDFVDLVGFDIYHRNAPASNEAFKKDLARMISTLQEVARENKKLSAITEMGQEQLTEKYWWTEIVVPAVENTRLSYLLVWRNGRPDHFYAPFEGQQTAEDFRAMIRSGKVKLLQ
jgi:mannan endo-1,4-beta-mannosidase